jgi:ubiquinone/menaquinone biosynthesis C-methylase UbiE
MRSIKKIKEIFESGQNVMEFLRDNSNGNDIDSILISYDLQAGSYIEFSKKNKDYIDLYTNSISAVINGLGPFGSIMEIGVGEATVMCPLMKKLNLSKNVDKFGFDISWSRLRYAQQFCKQNDMNINLFLSDLFHIALPDNCIDIIYTSHSLEPNGGREEEALKELYRVASKYIVLLEPDFTNATMEGKNRIIKHGYVKDLEIHAKNHGFKVVEHKPFDVFTNPLNPTALTIIQKDSSVDKVQSEYVCPITKTSLEKFDNVYFSEESGLIYPIINNLPCLLESSAIVGTHFKSFNK